MRSELTRRLRSIWNLVDVSVDSRMWEADLSDLDARIQSASRVYAMKYGYGDTLSLSAFAARYQPIAAATDYNVLKVPFYSPGPTTVLALGGRVRLANKTAAAEAFTLKYSVDGGAKVTFTNTPTAAIAANTNGSTVQLSIDRIGGAAGVAAGWHTLEIWLAASVARSTAGEYVGFSIFEATIFEAPDLVDKEAARYN